MVYRYYDGTSISEAGIHIPGEFTCSNTTVPGIEMIVELLSHMSPIIDRQFTVDWEGGFDWSVQIKGSFDATGTQASGTWRIYSGETTCASGAWECIKE